MSFSSFTPLWFLFALPFAAAIVFFCCRAREERIAGFGDRKRLGKSGLIPSFRRLVARETAVISAVIIPLIIALCGPVIYLKEHVRLAEGTGICIVLDASRSMTAEDIAPSRFDAAKREINNFLNDLSKDNVYTSGRVGLIIFANPTTAISDLTNDISAFQLALANITPRVFDYIEEQGTNMSGALTVALGMFSDYEKQEKKELTNKFVIFLSDGEDNRKDAARLNQALEKYAAAGIKVYAVGVGEYGEIRIPSDGPNEKIADLVTTFSPNTLKMIKDRTGGRYYHYLQAGQLSAYLNDVLDSSSSGEAETEYAVDISWIFLGLGIVFICLWIRNNFFYFKFKFGRKK